MKIAVMQPTFNPWLGYFDMIDKVDSFVFLDDVKLSKQSWQVRNRILSTSGELFLTIPIKTEHRSELEIKSAQIDYSKDWHSKHLKTIEMSYKKANHFLEAFEIVHRIYQTNHFFLADFNIALINSICDRIGITTKRLRSSELDGIIGTKDLRLVNICNSTGADVYLSAQGSAQYIESNSPGGEIVKNNIKLLYHNFKHPQYKQVNRNEFAPYMGVLDLLFNEGFERALNIIRIGREEDYDFISFRNQKITNETS
jgi:hypothetical protein